MSDKISDQLIPNSNEFELIETMFFKHRIRLIDRHMDRLAASATFFKIPFNKDQIKQEIETAIATLDHQNASKVRLTLNFQGKVSINCSPIIYEKASVRYVDISPLRINSDDMFFYHKTTRRTLYEQEYQRAVKAGLYDVLFLNQSGQLTEASRNNLFIQIGNSVYTPPKACGILNGVYRSELLRRCVRIVEKELYQEDLYEAKKIYLSNAVRGLRRVLIKPTY